MHAARLHVVNSLAFNCPLVGMHEDRSLSHTDTSTFCYLYGVWACLGHEGRTKRNEDLRNIFIHHSPQKIMKNILNNVSFL